MIKVTCGNCNTTLTAKDDLKGKTFPCRRCNTPLTVIDDSERYPLPAVVDFFGRLKDRLKEAHGNAKKDRAIRKLQAKTDRENERDRLLLADLNERVAAKRLEDMPEMIVEPVIEHVVKPQYRGLSSIVLAGRFLSTLIGIGMTIVAYGMLTEERGEFSSIANGVRTVILVAGAILIFIVLAACEMLSAFLNAVRDLRDIRESQRK